MASAPLYMKVRDRIVDSLVRHEWAPGELLPSEKQLAERFAVAISTIRAAIGELVEANVLERVQGKGTFVAHHRDEQNRYRFFNVRSNTGTKEHFHRELLALKRRVASAAEASALRLAPGRKTSDVFNVRARLSTSEQPFALADIVVPAFRFAGLGRDGIRDGEESLYALYQAKYGVNIVRVEEQIFAAPAPATVAHALGLSARTPVLEVRRVAFTFNDVPVECRTTWVDTQIHHYHLAQGKS